MALGHPLGRPLRADAVAEWIIYFITGDVRYHRSGRESEHSQADAIDPIRTPSVHRSIQGNVH